MNTKKKLSRNKKVCLLMALLMLFCTIFMVPPQTVEAATVKELEDKLDSLESQAKKYKKELEGLEDKLEVQGQLRDNLDAQMAQNSALIAQLETEIEKLKVDIKKLEDEIDKEYKDSIERVRAMYMMDDDSVLYALLQSSSFSDYLDRLDSINRIHGKDQEVIQSLVDKQKKLEEKKKEQEQNKLTLKNKEAKLVQQKAEYDQIIEDIKLEMVKTQEKRDNIKAAESKAERELQDLLDKDDSKSGSYSGGEYRWPVDRSRGSCYISSGFGWRWMGFNHWHTGVDISASGIAGTPILASKAGKVVTSAYDASGFGNYVVISHGKDSKGNSYMTKYAHATRMIVSVGQKVRKGQVIGYVGSTGWSTGPHLHFEVRVNGVEKNPMNYL